MAGRPSCPSRQRAVHAAPRRPLPRAAGPGAGNSRREGEVRAELGPCRALVSLVSSASADTALYARVVACCDLPFGDGFGAKLEWLIRVLALTWLIDAAAHDAAGVPKHLFWVPMPLVTARCPRPVKLMLAKPARAE